MMGIGQDSSSDKQDATKKDASPIVRTCITNGAPFKDKDGKCDLTYLYRHLIAKDKEALACSFRSETGTCLLNKETMTQEQIDILVQMVLDDQGKLNK
jgi:hypothetical protein